MLLILQPVAGLKLFYADVDSPPVNYTPEVLGSQSIQLSDSVYQKLKAHVIDFKMEMLRLLYHELAQAFRL